MREIESTVPAGMTGIATIGTDMTEIDMIGTATIGTGTTGIDTTGIATTGIASAIGMLTVETIGGVLLNDALVVATPVAHRVVVTVPLPLVKILIKRQLLLPAPLTLMATLRPGDLLIVYNSLQLR